MGSHINVIQGSAEWFEARRGCVTASRISDVLSTRRDGKESAGRASYKMELLCEELTGRAQEHYVSPAMEWGIGTEPLARTAYEMTKDCTVGLVGFYQHPTINRAGASPDAILGKDGLVEFKCPNTSTHLEYILQDCIPMEYERQMMWQMACTGRQWCDFVSYDPRLPEELQLFVMRLPRNDEWIAAIEAEVIKFIAELDQMIADLRARQGKTMLELKLQQSL